MITNVALIGPSHFFAQDEILFDSWDAIFNDGRMKENVPIYSFDGKDVLNDSTW